jgi:hypothetical protein
VFKNLSAVCGAAGGDLNDIVKLNIFLTDLSHFPTVNEIMAQYFSVPYPARAAQVPIASGALLVETISFCISNSQVISWLNFTASFPSLENKKGLKFSQ